MPKAKRERIDWEAKLKYLVGKKIIRVGVVDGWPAIQVEGGDFIFLHNYNEAIQSK